jgi:hypothetical protein
MVFGKKLYKKSHFFDKKLFFFPSHLTKKSDFLVPLHILKSMKIQGFEPRCNEKVTIVGIEPPNNLRSESLNHLAILALSVR